MLAGLLLLWMAWAQAQSPAPATAPDLDLRTTGEVRAIARQPDGGVVFGGDFAFANGVSRRNIARLRPNGSLDLIWNPSADGAVLALAVDASGAVFAGGTFTEIGGLPRSRIAKLSGSGTGAADPAWDPSANGSISTLAADNSGSVYAGGSFTVIGGLPRSFIAKLSGTGTGAANPAWNPSANSSVQTLALDANDAVFVAGPFTQIGGLTRGFIAKLSGSGIGAADPAWNPAVNNLVFTLAVATDGAVYAGGQFTQVGGLPRNRIAKLSGTGSGAVDPAWSPSANSNVSTLVVEPGGAVYAGGGFTQIGGLSRSRIAKLSGSGSGAVDPAWNPSANEAVLALAVDTGGAVYAGGPFTQVGGQLRRALVRLDIAGAPAPQNTDAERAGSVMALATQPDGGVIVGGLFHSADGQPRANLLRLRPDHGLDPDWNPSANNEVMTVATDASGAVYAGGQFTQIGGLPRSRIAKLSAGGTGAVDPDWNPSASGLVRALAVDATGAVYAGGIFSQIGGLPRGRIAKLSGNGAGAADPDWNPSANNVVLALALGAGGALYAGGGFTQLGGLPRNRIAKLSLSGVGVPDPAWNPSANGIVRSLAIDSGGAVYAGGDFTGIGALPRDRIAKLPGSGTGAADPVWNPSANDNVWSLAVDADGAVYAGGEFTAIGGLPRSHLARLSGGGGGGGTGAADPVWNPSANGLVQSLAVDADDMLLAGGSFNQMGSLPRAGLAAFAGDLIFASGFEPATTTLR